MRTNQQRPSGYTSIALFLGVLLTVAVIGILLSSAMERGGWMFIGLVIGLVIVVGLIIGGIAFGMNQYERRFDKRLDAEKEYHRHIEAIIGKNVLLIDGEYKPLHQIAAPTPQGKSAAQGIQFDSASLSASATNLLLFSINLLGEESKRIASNPECAEANIPGYNGRKWDMIIHDYLEPKYGVVAIPGQVKNGGGTYVPDDIGSIGALYKLVVRNSGVDTLPEGKRRA